MIRPFKVSVDEAAPMQTGANVIKRFTTAINKNY
jgi:hypothetical protein